MKPGSKLVTLGINFARAGRQTATKYMLPDDGVVGIDKLTQDMFDNLHMPQPSLVLEYACPTFIEQKNIDLRLTNSPKRIFWFRI